MGFFDGQLEKIKVRAKTEVEGLLLNNEAIEHFYVVKEDYCAVTNKRLLFVDNSISSKKATSGIPFNKINAVSLKRGGTLSISKEVIVLVGSKEFEIDLYSSEDAIEIFKLISERIV